MLPNEFSLVVGESVIFRFFQSKHNEADAVGKVVSAFALGQLNELSPLSVRLDAGHYQAGEMVRIYLTLVLLSWAYCYCKRTTHQSDLNWTIEFQVREV